jgi:hypothetical protein
MGERNTGRRYDLSSRDSMDESGYSLCADGFYINFSEKMSDFGPNFSGMLKFLWPALLTLSRSSFTGM